MKVVPNEAWTRFSQAIPGDAGAGELVRRLRFLPLWPGGRCHLTLFERVDGGRPHPRLRATMPDVDDPAPPARPWVTVADATSAGAFEQAVRDAVEARRPELEARDLPPPPPERAGSPRYWQNSVASSRRKAFLDDARAALDALTSGGGLPAAEAAAARYALGALGDELRAGEVSFDDHDTGTYHSFGQDAPFVHYLEALLEDLPADGSEGAAALGEGRREAVRRQREQAQAHLDHLMRHKYAYNGIQETDIERSLGGFLVDRETRAIASETEASRGALLPRHELLRVAPGAPAHANAWVYRDGVGGLRRSDDHALVEVDPAEVRTIPVPPERLTFRRAPDHPQLRAGVRFDWDQSGDVRPEPIGWIGWAGHCDVKAILEQLGLTLADGPQLEEYRSDADSVRTFGRDLLLEMVASVVELGSVYVTLDGSRTLSRGETDFGGARNDSLPDRLQLQGAGPGRSVRWPPPGTRGEDAFRVRSIDDALGPRGMETVFDRYIADPAVPSFEENPHFLKVVEGDYALIDVSGCRLAADVRVHRFEPETGYLVEGTEEVVIDLRPDGFHDRCFLGTYPGDLSLREVNRVYLEPKVPRVVVETERSTLEDGRWTARPTGRVQAFPLTSPLVATLSREQNMDDPESFRSLVEEALGRGRNINADTDMAAEVWNGTVTWMASTRLKENRATRTEHWRVDLQARFGDATFEYLVRRDADGEPEAWCPVAGEGDPPDFLWQDLPDVGSKGVIGADWVVNLAMVQRGLVEVRHDPSSPGEFYVEDDHVKHVYERLWCALGGRPYTIVHADDRYAFTDRAAWEAEVARIRALRQDLTFVADDATVA